MTEPRRWPDEVAKLAKIQADAFKDAMEPTIRAKAVALTRHTKPDDWPGQVQALHEFVRDQIRYVHDANRVEELAPAAVVLRRGFDDCDGKVKLAIALARALGIEAQVHPVWRGPWLAHVQVRYKWPGSQNFQGNRDGWVIGDVTIRDSKLGEDPKATIGIDPVTLSLPLS